jgi:hypothetical protein
VSLTLADALAAFTAEAVPPDLRRVAAADAA